MFDKTLPADQIQPKLQYQGSPAVHTGGPEDPEEKHQITYSTVNEQPRTKP